jgi:hypothetical protein
MYVQKTQNPMDWNRFERESLSVAARSFCGVGTGCGDSVTGDAAVAGRKTFAEASEERRELNLLI